MADHYVADRCGGKFEKSPKVGTFSLSFAFGNRNQSLLLFLDGLGALIVGSCDAAFALAHKGGIPYTPPHWKQALTSPPLYHLTEE